MSGFFSRLFSKYQNRFESSGDERIRDTFKGDLNYESGKIFFMVFLCLIIMLIFVPNDIASHPYPILAVTIHLGYTVICAFLILLRFTRIFRYRPKVTMMALVAYLYAGTSVLAATAGPTISLYFGPFSVILMIPVFAPFPLKFKVLGTIFSILLFFIIAVFNGIDFTDPVINYSTIDLIIAAALSIVFSCSQNNMRYSAWEHRQKLKSALADVEQQDMVLKTVNNVSEILLRSDIDTFEKNLLDSMSIMASSVDADLVNIWKNQTIDGKLCCRRLFEWDKAIVTRIGRITTLNMSYADKIPEWEEQLAQGYFINGIVSSLSANERAILSPQGILSILIVPVIIKNSFWGFAGFFNRHSERLFTYNEISVLSLCSLLIANAMIRHETTLDIRTNATRLEAVVSNHPGMIFCVDENDTIILINGLYLRQLGLSSESFAGRNLNSMNFKPFGIELIEKIHKTFLEGPQDWILELDDRKFHAHSSPIYGDSGKVGSVVGSMDEITDVIQLQKELENALKMANQASKVKSEFLAKMSHEIRTPMNAIVGMTELALRADNLNGAREHIHTVKQASVNLLTIINDILDFSKIETGKLEILTGDYSFSSMVNDILSIIRMRVIDSQIRFAVNIDSNIPNMLIGDEIRIRQILLNILSNAVKYTEKGFVTFTVYAEETDDDTIILNMEVMDSGRGIKEEDKKNLFGEYAQFDTEKNRGIEGVGLGLAITKSMVTAMGGNISVSSEYGKGSTFIVSLPQKIASHSILAKVENPQEKNVIVYERREIYANSIVFAVDNLGVFCRLVSTDEELHREMALKSYSFIFISFRLFNKNKNTIMKYGVNSKLVVLTEFGEAIPDTNLNVLSMPVHCMSISDILNGVSGNFSYNENNELIVRFTAPEACILVVDDINTNLKVAEGLLLPYKMNVHLCRSGLEAIEAIEKNRYDLIFMDHKMPEMDGIEATLRIRSMGEKDSYLKELPIIALTANAVSGTKEMFIENGFNDFLSKPINTVKLNSLLEKWIPKAKQRTSAAEGINGVTLNGRDRRRETMEIAGLNIERGIMLSGGKMDIYADNLGVFTRDVPEKINEISEGYDKDDLGLYTIHVHGLKSALANIGAGVLSEKARALEAAGGRNDREYISANNEVFIQELKELVKLIKAELTSYWNRKGKNEPLDRELLKAELAKLKKALDMLDAGEINKVIENIRKFTQGEEIDSSIQSISDNILIAEYDEAIATIDRILKE